MADKFLQKIRITGDAFDADDAQKNKPDCRIDVGPYNKLLADTLHDSIGVTSTQIVRWAIKDALEAACKERGIDAEEIRKEHGIIME